MNGFGYELELDVVEKLNLFALYIARNHDNKVESFFIPHCVFVEGVSLRYKNRARSTTHRTKKLRIENV